MGGVEKFGKNSVSVVWCKQLVNFDYFCINILRNMEKIRLNKFISDSGYCSRRQADLYIEQGRVTVNMCDCTEKGAMVLPTDRVDVDGEVIRRAVNRIYIALNKPSGVTCTTDREDKTNIVDFVGHKERIFPIGRLDKLSQGLIFMTNDGDIVNKILRAGNSHDKEYVVTVDKPITDDFIRRMSSGVRLDAQTRTLPCKVTRESETRFRIILTQGINRQIRRMCQELHYEVRKLQRVRVMNITLSGIAEGTWRYFTQAEVEELNAIIEGSVGTEEASVVPREQRSRRGAAAGEESASQHSANRSRRPAKTAFNNYRQAGRNRSRGGR